MPAIVIQTESDELLAFLLVSGEDGLREGNPTRDCVLAAPPQSAELLDHPISKARLDHLHVEHRMEVSTADSLRVRVDVGGSGMLEMNLSEDGFGDWRFEHSAGEVRGKCEIAGS